MNYFEFQPEGTAGCKVKAYLQPVSLSEESDGLIPAVVICPGGGYTMVSEREGEPVAKEYYNAGFHAFVLYYAVEEKAKDLLPLCQLAAAIVHIRKNAESWRLDGEKIAVCGFSAGGHLAASLGTLFNEKEFLEVWKREKNVRPDAMILGYSVLTADEYAHTASLEKVSGDQKGDPKYTWFGLDKHVDTATPPTFLWHTASDTGVPVENSLLFAKALSVSKVPFEMHIFPEGIHGMSVCTKEVGTEDSYVGRWISWSIIWLKKRFSIDENRLPEVKENENS